MATTTTTGAKKIENSDQWGEIFDIHNDTVEAYDQLHEDTVEDYDDKIDDLSNAMGIVETGDVATHAIEAGQYVIWKRTLYTADAAITIGETLAATGGSKNLTAVEKGGLNALNASIPNFSNMRDVASGTSTGSNTNPLHGTVTKPGFITFNFITSSESYSGAFMRVNNINICGYQNDNLSREAMQFGFSFYVNVGDVVSSYFNKTRDYWIKTNATIE